MHNQVWHIFDTTKHSDHTFINIATAERQQKTITQEKTLYVNERTRMKISHPRRFTSMHRLSFYIEEILPLLMIEMKRGTSASTILIPKKFNILLIDSYGSSSCDFNS